MSSAPSLRASNWSRAFALALVGILASALPACSDAPEAASPTDASGAVPDSAPASDAASDTATEAATDASVDTAAEAAADTAAEAGPACTAPPVGTVVKVTVADLKALLDAGSRLTVVDVREPSETASGVIASALLMPWSSGVLKARHAELPTDRPLYVICQSGTRSALATAYLSTNGHACIHDTAGGMMAWKAASYPTSTP